MVFHLAYWISFKNSTSGSIVRGAVAYPELAPFAFWGRFGVEVFFVISGFVIAFSAASATPSRFARSRFLRLAPAAFICATITFLVSWLIAWQPLPVLAERYFRTLTFNLRGPWVDGAYWSLGVEITFYAMVFVLLLIRRFSWIEAAAGVLGLLSTGYWLLEWQGLITSPILSPDSRIPELLVSYGACFATGVFLWSSHAIRPTAIRCVAIAVFAVGAMAEIYLTVPNYYPSLRLLPSSIWLGSTAFIAASIYFDRAIASRLSSTVLSSLRLFGLATYPLYLIHDLVGAAILRWLAIAGMERFTALLTTFAIVIAAALVITVFVEPALRRAFSSVLDFGSRLTFGQRSTVA